MRLSIEQLEDRNAPAALNSLPGAPISIFLDFDGHKERSWGTYSNVSAPAYTGGEEAIHSIWADVADDFSPFNVNVTTVQPPKNMKNAVRVVIGGDGSWTGSHVGGAAYLNAWADKKLPNVAWVFPDNLGTPNNIAVAVSHETGHMFGLLHQSSLTQEYRPGPGDGTAPIMGYGYDVGRSLWWFGQTVNFYSQDAYTVLGSALDYRADETGTVTSGVIGSMSDVDTFTFTTAYIDVQTHSNLDALVEIFDANGNLVQEGALTFGTYTVRISSTGISSGSTPTSYGFNVGQYTITLAE